MSATTNGSFCSQSIMLGDAYVINKYLRVSLWVSWVMGCERVIWMRSILDLSEYIKAPSWATDTFTPRLCLRLDLGAGFQSTASMMNGNSFLMDVARLIVSGSFVHVYIFELVIKILNQSHVLLLLDKLFYLKITSRSRFIFGLGLWSGIYFTLGLYL